MVTVHKYSLLLATCGVLAMTVLAKPAAAQGSAIAHSWDAAERLQKGNLDGLERLRFLTALDFPPFNYLDADGRLSGFNIDLARAICAELEAANRCQIQALPWDELQSSLKSGQGEAIIAGLTADIDNRQTLRFTRPYLWQNARFAVVRGTELALTGAGSLSGVTVGVVARSVHERMLRAYFPKATIASFASEEAVFENLKSKKVDAIFGDGMAYSFWLAGKASAGCCVFAGDPYYSSMLLGNGMRIAVKAEDIELEKSLNFALKAAQEKGVIDELYVKYFPVGFY